MSFLLEVRGQGGSVFRLLIAVIVAVILIGFVLTMFGFVGPPPRGTDPLEQTKLMLESLQGQRARYLETETVVFQPGAVMTADQLSREVAYGQEEVLDTQFLENCYWEKRETKPDDCPRNVDSCNPECVKYLYAGSDFCFNLGEFEGAGAFELVNGDQGVRSQSGQDQDAKIGVLCDVGERMETSMESERRRLLEECYLEEGVERCDPSSRIYSGGIPKMEWVAPDVCSCAGDGKRSACCLIVIRDPLG